MFRFFLALCFAVGAAKADVKTVEQVETAAPECDTCLARQNGKRALRAYLAEKRAQEEAEENKDE
ncbi:MAG: hypothetical protein AAFY25_03445 [Pseudomonadota bacterium]